MKKYQIQDFIKDGLNDEKIQEIFFPKPSKRLVRVWKTIIEDFYEIKNYLDNRYIDSSDYNEIIIRINLHIENIEKCPICGKNKRIFNTLYKNGTHYLETCGDEKCFHIIQQKFSEATKLERYGDPYYTNAEKRIESYNKLTDDEKKEKQHQRELKMIEHYGVRNPYQLESVKEKCKQTLIKKYGVDHPSKSKEIQEKIKQTTLKYYGVDNCAKSEIVKEKSKQTCIEKYGVEYSFQSNNNKEKTKQTLLEKYNVDNPLKSDIIKEKVKQTCIEKYGVEYVSQVPAIKEKKLKTMNKKYGGNAPICDENIKKKIMSKLDQKLEKEYNTKKKNKSFTQSKPEDKLFDYIKYIFPDVIRSYRNKEKYPFNCDFYIPTYDLYIEYQGLWTHGTKPYEGTPEDLKIVNTWKSKNKQYYNNAIYVWTDLDVRKRNIAHQNKLNFKELWNLDEAKQFIDSLIQ